MSRTFAIVVLLSISLAGAAGGEPNDNTDANRDNHIVLLGMFQSPSDANDARTPCQRMRDFFDPKATDGVPGEKPAICDKVIDVIAGKAEPLRHQYDVPISAGQLVTDSRRRIVLMEPSNRRLHIFDFIQRKYTLIDAGRNDRMLAPYGVAVDRGDNLYVTDLQRGTLAVFDSEGKFKRYIGDFKGESAFEQPNSIAIDSSSGRIYVADAKRHFVLILDGEGKKLTSIGKRGGGSGPARFRLPTDLSLTHQELFVLDKRNRRVQVFDLNGRYKYEVRIDFLGDKAPKGMAVDKNGLIYILLDIGLIQALNKAGERLFQFGHYGKGPGEFRDPSGIYIDAVDRLYISDTGNKRVQVFQIIKTPSTISADTAR